MCLSLAAVGQDNLAVNATLALNCSESHSGVPGMQDEHNICPDGQIPCCKIECCIDADGHDVRAVPSRDDNVAVGWLGAVIVLSFCCGMMGITCVFYFVLTRTLDKDRIASEVDLVSLHQMSQYFPEELIQGGQQCVICLGDINGKGRKLQCGHCFHSECIMRWWTYTPRATLECPTCKQKQIFPESTEAVQRGSEEAHDSLQPAREVSADVLGHQSA